MTFLSIKGNKLMIKTCSCGMEGPVTLVFGWRRHRGKVIPQSNCRACRFKYKLPDPVRWMYQKLYPNDKNKNSRSSNFMKMRIRNKKDNVVPVKIDNRVYSYIAGEYVDDN